MKIIINADDFGVSSYVNKEIYKSAVEGYITSSTIIPVSEKLDEAIEMTKDLTKISFGIHLTFTDKFRSILKKPIFFSENRIIKLDGINIFNLNILIDEFSKQIEVLLDRNIKISHIDTHHHIHLFPLVLLAVLNVAKKYNINKLRSEKIIDKKMMIYKRLYRHLHHNFVKSKGIIQPTFYTDFNTFFNSDLTLEENIIYEIMCHPGSSYNDEYYFKNEFYDKIKSNLISYNELL